SRRAFETRRFRLAEDFCRRGALVSQRRHLRVAIAYYCRINYRSDASGQSRRRRRLVRSELPRELWKISGGQDRAVEVINRIVKNVDVLVGNEEDLQKGLGIPGPEV